MKKTALVVKFSVVLTKAWKPLATALTILFGAVFVIVFALWMNLATNGDIAEFPAFCVAGITAILLYKACNKLGDLIHRKTPHK